MKQPTQIFYDLEATSVARTADPISIGLVAVLAEGKACTFYGEMTDFDRRKCDEWVLENVVNKLRLAKNMMPIKATGKGFETPLGYTFENIEVHGDTDFVAKQLKLWLSQFGEVEFWGDFDMLDSALLVELLGGFGVNDEKAGLPTMLPNVQNVPYYAFYDLHTLIREQGLHPDMSRQDFIAEKGKAIAGEPHNALYDAWVCAYTYLALAERQEGKGNLAILQDRLETMEATRQALNVAGYHKAKADLEAQIREAEYALQKYNIC